MSSILTHREKKKINLVHDADLEMLLKNLGILDDFKNGRRKCKFCKEVVGFDNLHSLFIESGAVKLICDKPQCIKELIDYI